MTDEARIARLAELARRVYGEDLADRITPVEVEPGHYVILHGRWKQLMRIDHPRALDALEAALSVLAERDLKPHNAVLRARLEQLAETWQRMALDARDRDRTSSWHDADVAEVLEECVRDLRDALGTKPEYSGDKPA